MFLMCKKVAQTLASIVTINRFGFEIIAGPVIHIIWYKDIAS